MVTASARSERGDRERALGPRRRHRHLALELPSMAENAKHLL